MTRISMTDGAVGATLRRLSLPQMKGMLAYMAFNLVDTYFIGKLGKDALAAMSYSFPIVMVILGISMGIATGASAIIARAIGQNDHETAALITTNASILALLLIIPLTLVASAHAESIFRLLGASGESLRMVVEYMHIWFAGLIFIVLPQIGNNAMRALGNMHTPSRIIMLAAAINAVLDPIFIFGLGPIPAMALRGAALASLISFLFIGVISFGMLIIQDRLLTWPSPKTLLRSWAAILRLAIPSILTTLIAPIGLIWITYQASQIDDAVVAAIGVAGRIEAIAMIGIYAMALIMVPFVGQNFGAQHYERIDSARRKSLRYAFFWGLFSSFILAISAPFLARMFTSDSFTIQQICWLLWIVPPSYFAAAWLAIAGNMATGLDAPSDALTMNLSKVGLLCILVWIGAQVAREFGLYFSLVAANLIGTAIAYLILKRRMKLTLQPSG